MLLDSSPLAGVSDVAAASDFLPPISSNPYPTNVTTFLGISNTPNNSFIPSSQVSGVHHNRTTTSNTQYPLFPYKNDQDSTILHSEKTKTKNTKQPRKHTAFDNEPKQPHTIVPSDQLTGTTPVYASLPPLLTPLSSWLEMGLQGQTMTFSVLLDNQEIIMLIQNPTILAQVVSDGMRIAMETYNNHLWMTSMFHAPMNFQNPIMPFFHIPTWQTPYSTPHATPLTLGNPDSQPSP
ncbi:hypothetical protein KY290_037027 [Solanum tuberosum]|uniref:Uncharacterized protein n=1 Tax=Solanum tuberosum TaxID=4113 RepID=A0ABQ7TUC3_SOLTU|nr:hypothetical protein KY289_036523 [Solanum tuberosum]KAH0738322.1 hypothetical protein KY290_037027 [Solanum tuberosum]